MRIFLHKILTILIVFTCSFQLAFARTIARIPASTPEGYILDLQDEIFRYKQQVEGWDDNSHCEQDEDEEAGEDEVVDSEAAEREMWNAIMARAAQNEELLTHSLEENTQQKYDEMLAGIQKNACGYSKYSTLVADEKRNSSDEQPEQTETQGTESCMAKRVPGLIERFNDDTIRKENLKRTGRVPPRMKSKAFHANKEFKIFYSRATEIKRKLDTVVKDGSFEIDERRKTVVNYLSDVVLPLRDFVVTVQAYTKEAHRYHRDVKKLLPSFSSELFSKDSAEESDAITQGNSAVSPFNLKMVELGNGKNKVVIDSEKMIARDIVTLTKSKTAKNYVLALKWMTLKMMASQIFTYDSIINPGKDGDIAIPNTCRNQFSANIPDSIQFAYKDEAKGLPDKILKNHGLVFDQDDLILRNYYEYNANKDPLIEGYSGITPFEDYKNARVEVERVNISGVESGIDDSTHFSRILKMKQEEVGAVFNSEERGRYGRTSDGQRSNLYQIKYPGEELFDKIMMTPLVDEKYELADGELLLPYQDNLSVYLAERMQRQGISKVENIINIELKERLEENKVKVSFPPLYGASLWRQWGINQLSDFLMEQKSDEEINPHVRKQLINTCTAFGNVYDENGFFEKLCPGFKGYLVYPDYYTVSGKQGEDPLKTTLAILSEQIAPFKSLSELTPLRRVEDSVLSKRWNVYKHFWNGMIKEPGDTDFGNFSEHQFLLDQLSAGNPWARLRLSYLVLLEELKEQRDGFEPTYVQHRKHGKRLDNNSMCFRNYSETHIEKIKEAAAVLGLDKILTPYHSNRILNKEEKLSIWRSIVDEANTKNEQLFATKRSSGESYYELIDKINYQTLLSQESVQEVAAMLPSGIDQRAEDEIFNYFETREAKVASFYLDLYKMKGDIDSQIEYFYEFGEEYGLDNEYDVAIDFLKIDSDVKGIVYKSILREAAVERKKELVARLDEFCGMKTDDHKKLKAMFYMTSKSQSKINKLAGFPEVPSEVMDEIEKWTLSDTIDLGMGLGAAVLGIGAALAGGLCTFMTAGTCAPFALSLIAAGLGSGALQIGLGIREYGHYTQGQIDVNNVKAMEELGFAELGSAANVGRHWGWAVFEAVSFFPLIGMIGRGVNVGARLFRVSRHAEKMKLSKESFKREVKTAIAQEEVRLASSLIHGTSDFDQISVSLAEKSLSSTTINQLRTKYDKIMHLAKSGKITHQEMLDQLDNLFKPYGKLQGLKGTMGSSSLGKVIAIRSQKEINDDTVKVLAEHFGGDWKSYLKLMKLYRKWSQTVITPHNPLIAWRMKHLIANKEFLSNFTRQLEYAIRNGDDVSKLILNNIDQLTHLHLKAPMKKRSILHLFFVQGVPHKWEAGFAKSMRHIAGIGDEIVVKKIFTANARLSRERILALAREKAGLELTVQATTTFDVFKAFDNLVSNGTRKGELKVDKIKYRSMKRLMARKALVKLNEPKTKKKLRKLINKDLSEDEILAIMFNPRNVEEGTIGEILWNAAYTDDMINVNGLPQFAHEALKEISYDGVEEFKGDFMTVMKLLLIQRDPAVVDFF